jgi:sodium transport system permease protein
MSQIQIKKPISASKAVWTVFSKEVIDNLRDRRTLTTILFSMLLGPILLLTLMWFAEKKVKDETDLVSAKAIELPVVGADYAPNLMAYLKSNNFEILEAPENPEAAVIDGSRRAILVIEEGFAQALRNGKPAPIRVIHDSSISGLEELALNQLQMSIMRYSQTIGALRLQARGVSPQTLNVIQFNTSDVATPEARNSQVLNMLPYIVIFSIMMGGMYLAIDTTAGEREKGSLEPLLAQPVDRAQLVLGKWFATCLYSSATFLLVLVSFSVAFKYMPIESVTVTLTAAKVAFIFIACFPFVLVGTSAEIVLASYTKSFKEAQSYMGMVTLIPTLPLLMLILLSPQPDWSNMWIPSFSQGLIMIEAVKGEALAPQLVAVSMLTSTLIAGVFVSLSIWLYKRERILG